MAANQTPLKKCLSKTSVGQELNSVLTGTGPHDVHMESIEDFVNFFKIAVYDDQVENLV